MIYFRNEEIKLSYEPKVAVIIPTKGNVPLLISCINSIAEKTKYENYTVYVADTGSTREELDVMHEKLPEKFKIGQLRIVKFDYYNFADINNKMVNKYIDKNTDLLLFCNNDVQFINDVITNGVDSYLREPSCGTIGSRLYFADETLQHAGILLAVEPQIGLSHYGLKRTDIYDRQERKPTLGNTAALMFIPMMTFNKIGMFPENYNECFEDVELNLKCLLAGHKNIFNPNCVAYHLESQSRVKSPDKQKREHEDLTQRCLPFIQSNLGAILSKLKMEKYGNWMIVR